jgi:hypothetical protein
MMLDADVVKRKRLSLRKLETRLKAIDRKLNRGWSPLISGGLPGLGRRR